MNLVLEVLLILAEAHHKIFIILDLLFKCDLDLLWWTVERCNSTLKCAVVNDNHNFNRCIDRCKAADWKEFLIIKNVDFRSCYEHVWINQSSDLILINLIRTSHDAMSSLNLAHFFESFSALLFVVQHFLHSSLSSFF